MAVLTYATGVQHIGIPTRDIEQTVEFYSRLGFATELRTLNPEAGEKVAFLRFGNLQIETWETGEACGQAGAVDHIALDVSDIDQTYELVRREGYKILNRQIDFLPFWENGVRFFTIEGPNAERLEFCQRL